MDSHTVKLYEKRAEKFKTRLDEMYLEEKQIFDAEFCLSADPVAYKDRLDGRYESIKEGQIWGSTWESAWFHVTGKVPDAWAGKKVAAYLDFDGEALIFDDNGVPVFGLTGGSVFSTNYTRHIYHMFPSCVGGEKVDLWIEAAANHLFGLERDKDPAENCPKRYGHFEAKATAMQLRVFNDDVWHLRLDMDVLLGMYKAQPEAGVRRVRILRVMNDALVAFGDDTANVQAARDVLKPILAQPATNSDLNVIAVGHAHIDTGWLWPVRETVRKCARTFATQLALMEQYPNYVFGASQPQHYAFVKEYYPELYTKIKERVKNGQWELQGGMWVEADCNVIGGESMVRQFLHGKNFFMDEFGEDVNNLWLPDVFGYAATMPQIMKKAGVDYFLTQKLSWNFCNEFPHNTFKWRGIDGTDIITHFPPENNYNSMLRPDSLVQARDRFKEKDRMDTFISLFGIGDGGGGPKDAIIERGLRMRNLEGTPKLSFGSGRSFLEGLNKYEDRMETWHGELYLEMHRGTLTTQARVKRRNRKLEQSLRTVETLYACLPLESYPSGQLDELWKTLLINQFHDIIPGSSITEVYRDTHNEYDAMEAACSSLTDAAGSLLFEERDDALVLFNPLSYPYTGTVELPGGWAGAVGPYDVAVPVQSEDGRTVASLEVPALGMLTLHKVDVCEAAVVTDDNVLENDLVKYVFDANGAIVSSYDKELEREFIKPGSKGNVFSLYVDRPHYWDAWDIDVTYEDELLETAQVTSQSSMNGPVRQSISMVMTVGGSTITQKAVLAAGSKRLDFITMVDWNESHKMLRVAFPTSINSDTAICDIQYGYVKRPMHRNTSWDAAKFEVAAHKYADVSDAGCGAALLNDCKYGYKLLDGVLDLNLLRSPSHPDPDADRGTHEFTYSFLPHEGDLVRSNVMHEAAMLNMPPVIFEGKAAGDAQVPCRLESDGISLEVLKKAEKEECLIIRLVETDGAVSDGVLTLMGNNPKLVETDLMEWKDGEVLDGNEIRISLKPFEIRTYKIK